MRHNMAHRKLNRTTNQRKALLHGLCINLIERERIVTTLPKAKEIRPVLEKLVTKTRNACSMTAYKQLYGWLNNASAVKKLLHVLGPRMAQRPGGYLRIIKAGYRYGDSAPMAVIEFVDQADSSSAPTGA
jgi:large subunit ribosomal protein L17